MVRVVRGCLRVGGSWDPEGTRTNPDDQTNLAFEINILACKQRLDFRPLPQGAGLVAAGLGGGLWSELAASDGERGWQAHGGGSLRIGRDDDAERL
jgi:hypothetical protein